MRGDEYLIVIRICLDEYVLFPINEGLGLFNKRDTYILGIKGIKLLC